MLVVKGRVDLVSKRREREREKKEEKVR